MHVRKIKLTVTYDPDWVDIYHAEIPVALSTETEAWRNGDVTIQDLEASGTPYTITMEVVHD